MIPKFFRKSHRKNRGSINVTEVLVVVLLVLLIVFLLGRI